MRVNIAGDDEDAKVQMEPLIDCMFLLLIFFLVATTLKKIEEKLDIDLPRADAAVKAPVDEDALVISLDRKGVFYLGADPVSPGALLNHIKKESDESKGQRKVKINGDRKVPFESVVEVFELCRIGQLNNIAVHVNDFDE
jgi:biopolymer transport protein ExbD